MNLVLLPGNSKRNLNWLEQVDIAVKGGFDDTYRHSYAHWLTGHPELDLELEVDRLKPATHNLSPYMVFAKSAGSVLTAKASYLGALVPQACLMVGLPIAMVDNQNLPIKRWLDNANFPITIIQHTHDPLGSFSEVERIISEVNRDINFLEIPGDSHDYNEFLLFTDILEGLRKAT